MAATETETREVRAEARYVRAAPRKAQLVVSEIRGLPVAQAKTMLAFMTRAAARDVERVLASAVANAEANHDLVADDLYVSAAYVGAGPTLKRWRPRARGRVNRIKKRTCHITIRVAPMEQALEPAPPRRAKAAEEAPKAKAPAARARRSKTAEEAAPAAEEKPKRTRAPKAEKAAAAPEAEAPTAAAVEAPEAETAAEETVEAPAEKPKRTRKPKAAPAEAEPAEEAAPEAEAEPADDAAPEAAPEAAEEPPPAAEEKPKRAPRSRKKAEQPAADDAEAPEGEES
jgi:large subunit ribosomal protein L22